VTSKLSKIRKANLFIPSPATYAKSALAQLAKRPSLSCVYSPYFFHKIQRGTLAIFSRQPFLASFYRYLGKIGVGVLFGQKILDFRSCQ